MLTPGEISKGMFVTVLENKPYEQESQSLLGDTIQKVKNEDRSGYGNILEVMAIQLPYVVVKRVDEKSLGLFRYDTRRTTFMELNEDYLKAYGIQAQKTSGILPNSPEEKSKAF